MQKVLIVGRGQIGGALTQELSGFDVHVWSHDLDDLSSEALEVIAPDAVVNAAGKTNLAWCEEHAREAVRSNLEAPVRLYQRIVKCNLERSRQIRYVHFSSGCVWDGPFDANGKPFAPTSPATPACLYSWTKAAADAMLLSVDPEQLAILRPRQVYSGSDSARNILVKLLGYPKLVDTPNSMSSMHVIAKTLAYVVSAESDWTGIWNVYDRGIISPFEVGELLAAEGLRDEPIRITKEELDGFHTPKRVDTVLRDDRLERRIDPRPVREELQQAIARLKERLPVSLS